jgi:hypothetical protein
MLWTKGIKLRTETSPQQRVSNTRELASQALRLPSVLVLGEMPVRNFIPFKRKIVTDQKLSVRNFILPEIRL